MTTKDYEDSIQQLAEIVGKSRQDPAIRTFFRILRTADILIRYTESKTPEALINRTERAILDALVRHGGRMSQNDLAKAVYRSTQAVTNAVDQLEKHGLAQRLSSAKDRRVNVVRLTEKGVCLFRDYLPQATMLCHDALSCFTEPEIEELGNNAVKLGRNLLKQIETSTS